jgi:hypothetical protein
MQEQGGRGSRAGALLLVVRSESRAGQRTDACCRAESSVVVSRLTPMTGSCRLDGARGGHCVVLGQSRPSARPLPVRYSAGAAAARANGLPSESRHTAHRSPGWMTDPPSARTRSSVVDRSATVKYGREAVSPGPGPRSWTPRRRLSVSVCHPDPAAAGRGVRSTPRTPCQNRRARSASSAGNSMSRAGMGPSMATGDRGAGKNPGAPSGRRAVRSRSRAAGLALVAELVRRSRLVQ